jgi:hypothetical protein
MAQRRKTTIGGKKTEKKVIRYTYDDIKEPRTPETGHTPLLPADEQVVRLPMDSGWSKAIQVGKLPEGDERPVVQTVGVEAKAREVARRHRIFVADHSRCRLGALANRKEHRGLGADTEPPLIDAHHGAMLLLGAERRQEPAAYLGKRGMLQDAPF